MAWILDIRYAFRLLIKAPKFTALTLLVLIGGLSLSLFTFSFLYSLVYKPLPLPEGESIYRAFINHTGDHFAPVAYEYEQALKQLDLVAESGRWESTSLRLSNGDTGKTIPASFIEPSMFSFTRTQPILGRAITDTDLQPDAPKVVLLSFSFWQTEFHGDPDIVGKTVRLNDTTTSIVGVMPEGYLFPINSKLWVPLPQSLQQIQPTSKARIYTYLRLQPGVTPEQAERELSEVTNSLYQANRKQYDKPEGDVYVELASFPSAQTDREGGLVFSFFNLIAFAILILACINVGNLLLARAIERQKEIAIRAALGAPRTRLTLHLMWEGIIITLLGGLLSVLLVGELLSITDRVIKSALPDNIPFWWSWGLDWPTLLMAILFVLVTIILASFIPAWRAANQDINATLRDGTRGAQSRKAGKLSRMLVTFQIFLISTLLLMGSVSAFIAYFLLNLDFGVNNDRVYFSILALPKTEYTSAEEQRNFYQGFLNELKASPQITNAFAYSFVGQSEYLNQDKPSANVNAKKIKTYAVIGQGDFYRAELLQGRHIDARDHENAQKVVLISESMAERYWPGDNVLGRPITIQLDQETHTVTIVGVVANLADGSSFYTETAVDDEMYLSGLQFITSSQRVLYQYHDNAKVAEESYYKALFKFNRTLEPYSMKPAAFETEMMKKTAKLIAWITFGSAGFALLLALTGIYGLTANSVAQRTHEIGVRRAVGATDRSIIRLFLKYGSRQLVVGIGAGLLLFSLIAFAFQNFTENMLPIALYAVLVVAVVVVLSCIVMVAIYLPTRKAVKLEPSEALRYE